MQRIESRSAKSGDSDCAGGDDNGNGAMKSPNLPVSSWCSVASLDEHRKSTVLSAAPELLDMSDWMESIEREEGRMDDPGGAGAYDTWRCDRVIRVKDDTKRWNQWGPDFHLQRLTKSYLSLLSEADYCATSELSKPNTARLAVEEALYQSEKLVLALLQEADKALSNQQLLTVTESREDDELIQIVKVTLLWSVPFPREGCCKSFIVVRGHACSTGQVHNVHQPAKPVLVTIAASHHHSALTINAANACLRSEEFSTEASIPSRFDHNPERKIAKWTRLRKQIACPEGIGEVLLVKSDESGRWEVLEGLSSNVFCVYHDDTIRTATNGVLLGFVRHLVLESIEECGLTWDPTPIWLDEAELPGFWVEFFITSSSRLIYPVSKVLCQEGDGSYQELWKCDRMDCSYPAKWQLLFQSILCKGGYAAIPLCST